MAFSSGRDAKRAAADVPAPAGRQTRENAPGVQVPPHLAGTRSGSYGNSGELSDQAMAWPEKCASMAMPHTNARAAIAFAVTMVVGVLVMGAFLG